MADAREVFSGFSSGSSTLASVSDIPVDWAEQERLAEAVETIQRAGHRFVCRRHIHRETESRHLAATRIQAAARGFITRRTVGRRHLISEYALESDDDEEA